jgi:hypothetical protein
MRRLAERIRCGIFHNIVGLETTILQWTGSRNQAPRPFDWSARAKPILASLRRAKKALATAKEPCTGLKYNADNSVAVQFCRPQGMIEKAW